jgi:hypothetical protein
MGGECAVDRDSQAPTQDTTEFKDALWSAFIARTGDVNIKVLDLIAARDQTRCEKCEVDFGIREAAICTAVVEKCKAAYFDHPDEEVFFEALNAIKGGHA